MADKMPPCCARRVSTLRMEKADLARIARRASRAPESARWQQKIVEQKAIIAEAQQNLIDHEAQHASEGVAA